ncbi:helix-turn-helix transcriptional regulator [Sutcliffiella horikoshii]|uniref:helix-turn-helix domain-containing protein n=1 Tax=Sutcliffiella horikoshii TaxID=79883 RepID=UPI00203F33C4|nr:helix-turn-helix transcriptional regulator [Sutcliffiella horikoshii]MCM3619474.1 helix-turn-helix transcriptional regulator [Sutcliffiella horikoshii]
MDNLGYKLRVLRYDRDINQKDAASQIGISANSLSYYENNKRKPKREVLKKLAAFYGIEIEELFNIY